MFKENYVHNPPFQLEWNPSIKKSNSTRFVNTAMSKLFKIF